MKYSVIIGTLNHLSDCLKPCCESIIRNTTLDDNIEIIIVGNGCTDGTKDYVNSLGSNFLYLDFPKPLGYAGANNEGLKVARGDYLILLNNDTTILDWGKDKWLNLLTEPFEKDDSCGIAGPSLSYSEEADAEFIIFFCAMISRGCFSKTGYLDEEFKGGGGEDIAYCVEARERGFKIVQTPLPGSLLVKDDYKVGTFPIYHAGEKTVRDLKDWDGIFKRNIDILYKRYNKKFKLSNNYERAVIGKKDKAPPRETARYNWAKQNIFGSKILEIGCSSGYGTEFLKDIPGLDYLGIDYDKNIIDYAKKNFGRDNIRFEQADINTFKLDQYDTIIGFEIIEHLDNGKELIKKLKKHCKRLLVSVPYRELPGVWGPHHKLHNLSEADFPDFEYCCVTAGGIVQNELVDAKGLSLLLMVWSNFPTVTCVIPTKDRSHTTLPMTVMGVCGQSVKPQHLIIYDDGEPKADLDKDPIYRHLFSIISASNISWEYKYGKKLGQVVSHIQSVQDAKTTFIWRLDDDTVPDYNVLEGLLSCVSEDVGAVGGLVINNYRLVPSIASNKIEDIYLGLNEQWFFHKQGSSPKEVDHLYSSFIYRRSVAEYPANMSTIGHREETILTHDIKRKGYKVILNPQVKTWHFNNPSGGIRSKSKIQDVEGDSYIFTQKLSEWEVSPNDYSFAVLENGLGDTFAFKSVVPQYLKSNPGKKHIFFVTYPDAFWDIPDIKLASIEDAKNLFGDIGRFNLYKFIHDERWSSGLPAAYKKLYKIQEEVTKTARDGTGNAIIISPYSFHSKHPKSYPFWEVLLSRLKQEGHHIIQIGLPGEEKIKGLDEYCFGLSFKDLAVKISTCKLWISVDNFLPHFVNSLDDPVKGVVLWGTSDPNIFGYPYNLNILKSRDFLRKNQIDTWDKEVQNIKAFETPDKVLSIKRNW